VAVSLIMRNNFTIILMVCTFCWLVFCAPKPRYTREKKYYRSPPRKVTSSSKRSVSEKRQPGRAAGKKTATPHVRQEIVGVASYYGKDFHGKKTANGEIFDMYAMTAAHKTLPLGTRIKVVNLKNKKSIEVKVNDRGPYVGNRILDLSYGAAKKLAMVKDGTAKVKIIILKVGDNEYKR